MKTRDSNRVGGLPAVVKAETRDLASDWRDWSWAERVAVIVAMLLLVGTPLLVGAVI